jgi:phenylalanyl-tRNA synthetase beta chain
LFELDLSVLQTARLATYQTVAKFPPVRRDIALLVDQQVPADALLQTMLQLNHEYVQDIALFDLYQGQGVAPGKKSLAFKIILQDSQKSLTDEEIESAVQKLLGAVAKSHQAELRN